MSENKLVRTDRLQSIIRVNQSRDSAMGGRRGHGGMLFTGLLPIACSACLFIEPMTTVLEVAPPTLRKQRQADPLRVQG